MMNEIPQVFSREGESLFENLPATQMRKFACHWLAKRSDVLAGLMKKNGMPPVWDRQPDFESLVWIILEQSVSLESARAVYEKLQKELGTITPGTFLAADDQVWKQTGFSKKKWKTCHQCADLCQQCNLNLSPNSLEEDLELKESLMRISGIGNWTVNIYFLLVLQRNDIWPITDRALTVAVSEAFGMKSLLCAAALDDFAENWRPLRSWAARIFWHDYLSRRDRVI